MQALSASFLSSATAQRLGFKPLRILATREEGGHGREPSPALPNTLAHLLQARFTTVVTPAGLPAIVSPDRRVFELDPLSDAFVQSRQRYDSVVAQPWGCVAPVFRNLVDQQNDPTVTAYAAVIDRGLRFETIPRSRVQELHEFMEPDVATGFVTDAHHFNAVLSRPISTSELRSAETFHHIFPEDDALNPGLFPNQEPYAKDDVGRIIISYRHQSYYSNRISFHDWLCASHAVEHVINAYGWTRTRFWTDARLRQYAKDNDTLKDTPWAEIGLDPYFYGPVVVLNLSRKPSISERFWLTVERRTGAHYYGTWLTDDAGESFYFYLPKGDDVYSRALVTSVSTSQGITWASDRQEILDHEWDQLQVADVDHALRILRESMTFEAREDFVDEDVLEVSIAEKGKTLQWCGDVEALVDPPSLLEVFGSVGGISHNVELQILHVDIALQDTKVTVVIFKESDDGNVVWIAKRLYVDDAGEIRARSVPRLVDEDYGENLEQSQAARRVDLAMVTPPWLASSRARSGSCSDNIGTGDDGDSV